MNDLYVNRVRLEMNDQKKNQYPFNIKVLKNFESLELTKPVTFLIGENGVGKSTFIEAVAVGLGLNAEGGTQNFNFYTKETHSELYEYLKISKGIKRPKTKFFLRAETFYNVSSELDDIETGLMGTHYKDYGGKSLHVCSHGEAFMQLMQNRFTDHGLYILDEPEAALSPSRQLSLLVLIDELVKQGSQFIISTHSPILIAYRDGEILDLNHHFEKVNFKDTDIYQTYIMFLQNPEMMQHHLFDE